ncbi:MAG: helix-turn-helix domain-containing protein [Candidatus Actinomarinaceae bacterium]
MKLREYMVKNGLNNIQISELSDISEHTIAKYKNDIRIPRLKHMTKIFDITQGQVTPNDFYGVGQ